MIEPFTRLTASLCAPVDHTKMIALDSITPNRYQSRREFDREALEQLAQSIYKHGLLQNITVRAAGPGRYELIAGERRVRACQLLGQSHIRATIIHADEREAAVLCLLENLQRQDLNFFEEAQGYERLVRELGMTQQQLAQSLGLAQSTVANRLRLLRLSDSVRTEILRLGLTERHARELLRLHDTKMQLQAIDQIACRMLNVRQTEDLIAHMLQGALSVERAKSTPSFSRAWRDWRLFANTMKTAVLELKAAGLNAAFDLHDTGDAVEMRVVVPKARGNPPVGANSPPSIP